MGNRSPVNAESDDCLATRVFSFSFVRPKLILEIYPSVLLMRPVCDSRHKAGRKPHAAGGAEEHGDISSAIKLMVQSPCNSTKKSFKKFWKKSWMCISTYFIYIYIKFQDQIRPPLEVTKKTNFLTKIIVQMQPKFVFFVTSRGGRIWPWNFIYRWSRLRCTFKIFFRIFWNFF